MTSLDRSGKVKDDTNVARAYACTADLFRQLLKQAVLAEPRFTEATIQLWKRAGKIETPWQLSQARHFLETSDIEASREKDGDSAGTGAAANG
jgi:hypothetical protein